MAAGDLVTMDGQAEWRGQLVGAGSAFGFKGISGWLDLPSMRGGNSPRAGRHGRQQGQILGDERTIGMELITKGVDLIAFPGSVTALRRVTALEEQPVEEPLVVQLNGIKAFANVRCTRRMIPADNQFLLGLARISLEFLASDIRIRHFPFNTLPTGLPSPASGGLDFSSGGLDFSSGGLDFGSGTQGGQLIATNNGNSAAWPVWRITGPVTGPIITNFDTGQRLLFDPTFTVAAGQVIEIDTDPRTIFYAGTEISVSHQLRVREWFPILPGVNTVRFSAATGYDPAAQLECLWYSTSM